MALIRNCSAAGLLLVVSTLSSAHTPYLVPNAFEPINGGLVTLDASFATHFFVPEVFFTDGSDFEVHTPDGEMIRPDTAMAIQTRTIVEHDLVDDGTYRFSTGRRLGQVFRIYTLPDGERFVAREPEEMPPPGAELMEHYQTNTIAETYVTRGAPSELALAPRGDGLEFALKSHPNDLFAGETLELQTLYYGEPVAGIEVEIFPASTEFDDDHPMQVLISDANGEITFTPEMPGVYLLRSRHRDYAPAGSAAPEMSHTYTLALEAFE